MSKFEGRTFSLSELPKSTESFLNMLDEVGQTPDDATRAGTDTFSMLSNPSGDKNYGHIDVGENKAENNSLDRNSSNDDSICTQCQLADRLNSFFEYIDTRVNETEKKVGSGSESDGSSLSVDKNCEQTGDEDQKNRSKRCFSDTAIEGISESRFSSKHSCKRFKFEDLATATKLQANGTAERIESSFAIGVETTEKSARNRNGTPFAEDEDPPELSERSNNNRDKVPQDTDAQQPLTKPADPDNSNSEISATIELTENSLGITDQNIISSHSINRQTTPKQVYNDIDESKNAELILEIETSSPNLSDSTISQSTIEEIHHIDDIADIGCARGVGTVEERPLQDPVESQINEGSDNAEEERTEMNPVNSSCTKSLESGTVADNDKMKNLHNNLEFQHKVDAQLKETETEDEIAEKGLNFVSEIRDRVPDADSGKSGEDLRMLDKSILEVSIESEKMYNKMNSTDRPNLRERREKSTSSGPVDLTTINKKNSAVGIVPLKDTTAENSKNPNDFATRLLADQQLEKNKKQDEMVPRDPPANFTLITESRNSIEDVDNLSLDFLSESELERMEKEAYWKSRETYITTNLNNVRPKNLANKRDMFYRPYRLITDAKDSDDDIVLPNWVTNPAPEPDYEKIRRRNQMRREFIKKILQEILRLSEIVAKVGKALRAERQISDSDPVAESVSQIRDLRPIQSAENDPNNRFPNLGASANTETIGNHCSRVETTAFKGSDVFYTPQSSSRPKHDAPSNLSNNVIIDRQVKLEASVNTADTVTANHEPEIRKTNKFYVSQSVGSKYDASSIFNQQTDEGLNIQKVSRNYNNTKASSFYNPSSIFGSLERDGSGDKTCDSVARNDKELGISRKFQLPKKTFQAPTVSDNRDKTVLEQQNGNVGSCPTNNYKTVDKDTIFYSPDKFSSASSEYTRLPSVRDSQIFFSKNLGTRGFGSDLKPVAPMSLNFGKNLTARTNRNNDSVFYSGNK